MTLDELEACAKIVFRRARNSGIEQIVPDAVDYYWTIGFPAWVSVYDKPEPIVGSLCDDESELMKLLSHPSRASAVDVERVASLLRMVSERIARQFA